VKPDKKKSNNFGEQIEYELNQLKDEYILKFTNNRTYIEQEINRLIDDERETFDKLNRYLNEQKRHSKKNDHKRKYSP